MAKRKDESVFYPPAYAEKISKDHRKAQSLACADRRRAQAESDIEPWDYNQDGGAPVELEFDR